MSDGWKTALLSELCDLKPPKGLARSMLEDDDNVSFVPMSDLGELEKRFEVKEVRRFKDVVNGYTYFGDGDVLCAEITPCFENGKLGVATGLANGVGFGSSEFVVMRSKGDLIPDYLFYYLSRDEFRKTGERVMSGAVGHKRVPRDFFEDLEVPLPPLDEQKRIVAKLDQAFAALNRARANAEANQADADSLQVSMVENQFADRENWSKEPLGARVRFIDYRGRTPEKAESGVLLLTAKNVRMGYIRAEPREFIAEEAYASWMTRGIPRRGDVLFTTEAPLANVAQVETDEPIALAQRLIAMQSPAGKIDSRFLKWSLMSPQMQSDIKQKGTGATVTGIKAQLLKVVPLYTPNLRRQQQIADACESAFLACAMLRNKIEMKLADMAALRQSLLQAAFSGQLS